MSGWDLSLSERIARLREAKAFILSIPDEEFYISHWWCGDGQAFDEDRNRLYRVRNNQCGCPVGHLCHKHMFGLDPADLKNKRERVYVIVGDAFGISYALAQFMFCEYNYHRSIYQEITKYHVASRMEYLASEMELEQMERAA